MPRVDTAYAKAKTLGIEFVYRLTDELWGVRRFYVPVRTAWLFM